MFIHFASIDELLLGKKEKRIKELQRVKYLLKKKRDIYKQ